MAYTKVCKNCLLEKPLEEFRIRIDNKRHRNICKKCETIKHYEYISKNKEANSKARKKYYEKNRDIINNRNKEYYNQNKEKIRKRRKELREINKEHINELAKISNKRNRKKISAREKTRVDNDILFRFKKKTRQNIRQSFTRKNFIKKENTEKIIGCNFEFFLNHLLQTFKNNYGYEWDRLEKVHIDHIIPLCTAHSEDEVIKLCHYTNLQLLKEKDNLLKSSKLNYRIKEEFICM